jgi:hypothetical protein
MRLIIILIAALLSIFAGYAATQAAWALSFALLPPFPPQSLPRDFIDVVVRLPTCVLIATAAFSIAVVRRDGGRAVWTTAKSLLLVPLVAVAVDMAEAFAAGTGPHWGFLFVLRLVAPFWVVVLVQWLVVRAYLRRRRLPQPLPPWDAEDGRWPQTVIPFISLLLMAVAATSSEGVKMLIFAYSDMLLQDGSLRLEVFYFGGLLAVALAEFAIRAVLIKRTERPPAVA